MIKGIAARLSVYGGMVQAKKSYSARKIISPTASAGSGAARQGVLVGSINT